MRKNKIKRGIIMKRIVSVCLTLFCVVASALFITSCFDEESTEAKNYVLVLDEEFENGKVYELSDSEINFPSAHVEDENGNTISYDVRYTLKGSGDPISGEYPSFTLGVGEYTLEYSYKTASKEISFKVKDTVKPEITFSSVPSGLFYSEGMEDQTLPQYRVTDLSLGDKAETSAKLAFNDGAGDKDWEFNSMFNTYKVTRFGVFTYTVTATDDYGNTNVSSVSWRVKDYNWQDQSLEKGYLADFGEEGYLNYIKEGDANSLYNIKDNFKEEWLESFEGANGVIKLDLGFNGSGSNRNNISLKLAKKYSTEDLRGKYLAVRMFVASEGLADSVIFCGNNIAFREDDSAERALMTIVNGIEVGKWKTYYISADVAKNLELNLNGEEERLQLVFTRTDSSVTEMTVYIDGITIAERLGTPKITVENNTAKWAAVENASGYNVTINGETTFIDKTEISLGDGKGAVKVSAAGDDCLYLNGVEASAVYGLKASETFVASFDDVLYGELFDGNLNFSNDTDNAGYAPSYIKGELAYGGGYKLEIGKGSFGICTGVRFLFPEAANTADAEYLVVKFVLETTQFELLRVYDYNGNALLASELFTAKDTGEVIEISLNLSNYGYEKLEGLQFIFGGGGRPAIESVKLTFDEIFLKSDGMTSVDGDEDLIELGVNNDIAGNAALTNLSVVAGETALPEGKVSIKDGKIKIDLSEVEVGVGTIVSIASDGYIAGNGKFYDISVELIYTSGGWMRYAGEKNVTTFAHYTDTVIQFANIYDFGVSEQSKVYVDGDIYLDGVKTTEYSVQTYANNTVLCIQQFNHAGKLITIKAGTIFYANGKAIVLGSDFNMIYDATSDAWTSVKDLPEESEISVDSGSDANNIKFTIANADGTTVDLSKFVITVNGSKPEITAKFENGALIVSSDSFAGDGEVILVVAVKKNSVIIIDGKYYVIGNDLAIMLVGDEWKPFTGSVGKLEYRDSAAAYVQSIIELAFADGAVSAEYVKATMNGQEYALSAVKYFADAKVLQFETVGHNPANGDILTIKQGSVIYSGDAYYAFTEEQTYIFVSDKWMVYAGETTFSAGYTANNLVQFSVYDFGCDADNTELGIIAEILIDGSAAEGYSVLGYANNKTITLNNVNHKNKVLTIKKGAIIYYNNTAIVLSETFNKKWDGSVWTDVADIPAPSEKTSMTAAYRFGNASVLQINTDLPSDTPLASFLATDNGSEIIQSGDQNFGWAGMTNADGTIVITFNFNSAFSAGQSFGLAKGSVFGFADGKKYVLEKSYVFKFDGSEWTMREFDPETQIGFTYIYGAANLIQVNTNLSSDTPCKNFTAGDNGCNIDQSGNAYQQMGWIEMTNADGTIVLTFHFNAAFSAGQTFVLPQGSVWGFTDGKTYTLDKNYTFSYDGSSWLVTASD